MRKKYQLKKDSVISLHHRYQPVEILIGDNHKEKLVNLKRRRKTVMIGDSQPKYIRGEKLSTRDNYVEVNSVSDAKVQQVPDLFSQELEDPAVSQIIVHIGTNSIGET